MPLKTMAGTALVPMLSRLVLGITFLLSGWFFCFQEIDFTASDMARIQDGVQSSEGASAEGGRALAVNRLIMHFQTWDTDRWAQPLGWAVAIFQLLGGLLLLLGLFTRVVALGVTVLIAGAFYQLTIQQNGMFEMNPFDWRLDSGMWYAITSQAGLFVLALGLFLTGGGPLCTDSLLWRRGTPAPAKKKGEESN